MRVLGGAGPPSVWESFFVSRPRSCLLVVATARAGKDGHRRPALGASPVRLQEREHIIQCESWPRSASTVKTKEKITQPLNC